MAQLMLPVLAALSGGKGPALAPLILYFALWELGDLYFSPAAMGLYSRLAPAGHGAVTMAIWYLTVFAGSIASGWIGGLWGRLAPTPYWTMIAALTALCIVIIFVGRSRMRHASRMSA
jgi:POT family proton-dependent oligopeptide transporter